MKTNTIYNEDCLTTLSKMEDNSIDLVITSPPYNKGRYANKNAKQSDVWGNLNGRKIAYDSYDDDMEPGEYESWQKKILSECLRVLKPTGSIFYNHKDIIYNGGVIVPRWVYDFPVKQQIIWDRGSSPMIDPHYFMPINEWIYWIGKSLKETFFDKEKSIFRTNIWRMNVDKNPHPAPFPITMAGNIVKCACPEGGIVYDPFMGSGTTGLATKMSGGGRTYIGSEISSNYVEMANKRIEFETADLLFNI